MNTPGSNQGGGPGHPSYPKSTCCMYLDMLHVRMGLYFCTPILLQGAMGLCSHVAVCMYSSPRRCISTLNYVCVYIHIHTPCRGTTAHVAMTSNSLCGHDARCFFGGMVLLFVSWPSREVYTLMTCAASCLGPEGPDASRLRNAGLKIQIVYNRIHPGVLDLKPIGV